MSRPLRIQYPDACYHVTCRGNEQREIFRDLEDRKTFLRLLERSVDIFDIRLLSYALMPNHFHLLACTPKGNLSEFMRHFNISYTGYFNRRHRRSGHLYQGRYKSFLIAADHYLLEVSRYIHLNPLRMKSGTPAEKRWADLLINDSTSLPGYLAPERRKSFVHYAAILDYFGGDENSGRQDYHNFVVEGMERAIPSPLEKGKGLGIVGEDDFIEKVKESVGKGSPGKQSLREQPALRELSAAPDKLIDRYAQLINLNREALTSKGRQTTERAMLMEFLYRFCKTTQSEIGRLMGGIDYSTVSQTRKRLRIKMKNEPGCQETFIHIQEQLSQISKIKI